MGVGGRARRVGRELVSDLATRAGNAGPSSLVSAAGGDMLAHEHVASVWTPSASSCREMSAFQRHSPALSPFQTRLYGPGPVSAFLCLMLHGSECFLT